MARIRRWQAQNQTLQTLPLQGFRNREVDRAKELVDLIFFRAPIFRRFRFLAGIFNAIENLFDADGFRIAAENVGLAVVHR